MKAVMVMFDSLNRHMLPSYGCDWVHAPNFEALAKRAVTFANCYAGSLPCLPARRELHTGRYNFLHRNWGPLEPFDDSMVDLLKRHGVYTHLATDHMHYLEDGGATYHTRYNSWEIVRGQEGDHWKGEVEDPEIPESVASSKVGDLWRHDWVNRKYLDSEEKMPQAITFQYGLEFIERNHTADNWFVQIESFDPHEPYYTQERYKSLYPHEYRGRHFDWPNYAKVSETDDEIAHARYEYAALVSMCDYYLGKVIEMFDKYDLWRDTLFIVNTDHGFLLGEHGWWGKNIQPFYDEIARIPLFIWDPRLKVQGERRNALVQTIDIAPTLLDYFGVTIPDSMQGKPLAGVIQTDYPIRDAALFGIHGGHVNCTDGRYVYMRAPACLDNGPLYEYTLIPTHMHSMFSVEELADMELAPPFSFTKAVSLLKIAARPWINAYLYGTRLYDVGTNPDQYTAIDNLEMEWIMAKHLRTLMRQSDAPPEQYERLGLPMEGEITKELLKRQAEKAKAELVGDGRWLGKSRIGFLALLSAMPGTIRSQLRSNFFDYVEQIGEIDISEQAVLDFLKVAGLERTERLVHLFMQEERDIFR